MKQWSVRFKPHVIIAMTDKGALESAIDAIKSNKTPYIVEEYLPLRAYRDTVEHYETMLDVLQQLYAEYIMDLTEEEVQWMVDNSKILYEGDE